MTFLEYIYFVCSRILERLLFRSRRTIRPPNGLSGRVYLSLCAAECVRVVAN